MELRPYQKQAIQESFDALKLNDNPVLLECSVGGGKSYLIGSIANRFDKLNKRVLCLVSSSELVRNNSDAYKDINGKPSIFCASLSDKNYNKNVIFATPQSLISALKNNHPIAQIKFNIIIIDEAHLINYTMHNSIFIRILRHYKQEYSQMRVLGMTGTPFRGNNSIVGENALFKTKVGNISTQYLIDQGYLVNPQFELPKTESFDFSKCKIKAGDFKSSDLQSVIDSKKRLTWEILQEVNNIMESRNVCIIFCSTKAHCYEALNALPENSARIILGETNSDERNDSLTLARNKKIKYLISVNCLLTGVNVPAIDCIAWLRPTSSLLLYIQGIGRGLRLNEGKKECLILDYAQNISRFQDFDDPIINDAIKQTIDKDKSFVIQCPQCMTFNTEHARRCIGIINDKRCDYYFEFKNCPNIECMIKNDISARHCRVCQAEIIDPNQKLSLDIIKPITIEVIVKSTNFEISGTKNSFRVNCLYQCIDGYGRNIKIQENYTPSSEKARYVFYGQFVRKHCDKASSYFMYLHDKDKVLDMLHHANSPKRLVISPDEKGMRIKKKIFD